MIHVRDDVGLMETMTMTDTGFTTEQTQNQFNEITNSKSRAKMIKQRPDPNGDLGQNGCAPKPDRHWPECASAQTRILFGKGRKTTTFKPPSKFKHWTIQFRRRTFEEKMLGWHQATGNPIHRGTAWQPVSIPPGRSMWLHRCLRLPNAQCRCCFLRCLCCDACL